MSFAQNTELFYNDIRRNAAERGEHSGGWWSCLRALGYHVRGVDAREAMYGQSAEA
ncbi:MAG: hypothetical protein AAF911_03280 [Planctomycetota bacterium]